VLTAGLCLHSHKQQQQNHGKSSMVRACMVLHMTAANRGSSSAAVQQACSLAQAQLSHNQRLLPALPLQSLS
jgi:hypothetical protein